MPTATEVSSSGFFLRQVETAANVATIVVAVLLSIVLVKNYLLPTLSQRPLQSQSTSIRPTNVAKAGINLAKQLSGVNWNKNGQTLVLALFPTSEGASGKECEIGWRAAGDSSRGGILPEE